MFADICSRRICKADGITIEDGVSNLPYPLKASIMYNQPKGMQGVLHKKMCVKELLLEAE